LLASHIGSGSSVEREAAVRAPPGAVCAVLLRGLLADGGVRHHARQLAGVVPARRVLGKDPPDAGAHARRTNGQVPRRRVAPHHAAPDVLGYRAWAECASLSGRLASRFESWSRHLSATACNPGRSPEDHPTWTTQAR